MAGKADGLIDSKYKVERLVPSSSGKDHSDCRYFVLDIDHDPLALEALHSYAMACDVAGYEKLADDLFELLSQKGYDE